MATARLAEILDREAILESAGAAFFGRGVDYVDEGRVGSITESDDTIEAAVIGADLYTVRVSVVGEAIDADCSCPTGQSGMFCKHCVALSLAWLSGPAASVRADPVEAFLSGLDRDELERLVVDAMARDEGLAARLRLRAAAEAPGSEGLPFLRKALDRATRRPRMLSYRDVPDFTAGVDGVADALEQLEFAGRGDFAIGLAERALRRLEKVLERADDSDGLIGDLLVRFQAIHLQACRAARPDPVELAERLFRWELDGDWDVFRGAAETYADVLGESGLAAYGRLAETEWAAVPARCPGDSDSAEDSIDRSRVTYMMGSLARSQGDVEMEIATMSRDLSSAYHFLRIARVCKAAGRGDEALSWAERGVKAFPEGTHADLREFLADEYLT